MKSHLSSLNNTLQIGVSVVHVLTAFQLAAMCFDEVGNLKTAFKFPCNISIRLECLSRLVRFT